MNATAHHQAPVAGAYAVALVALGHHMFDHQLPTPNSIDFPIFPGDHSVTVFVPECDHHAWISTVQVLASVDAAAAGDRVMTTWDVRLPDSGTRLRVKALRHLPFAHGPAMLAAVSA